MRSHLCGAGLDHALQHSAVIADAPHASLHHARRLHDSTGRFQRTQSRPSGAVQTTCSTSLFLITFCKEATVASCTEWTLLPQDLWQRTPGTCTSAPCTVRGCGSRWPWPPRPSRCRPAQPACPQPASTIASVHYRLCQSRLQAHAWLLLVPHPPASQGEMLLLPQGRAGHLPGDGRPLRPGALLQLHVPLHLLRQRLRLLLVPGPRLAR
jgi:hypothetical protein